MPSHSNLLLPIYFLLKRTLISTSWQEYLSSRKEKFPLGFVAPALQGRMLDQGKFRRGLAKLCKEAGVQKVTPHELRHSCTEVWFSHGASLEDVRRLLGHKCSKTTQTYVHRTDDRLIKLAKEIRLQSVTS